MDSQKIECFHLLEGFLAELGVAVGDGSVRTVQVVYRDEVAPLSTPWDCFALAVYLLGIVLSLDTDFGVRMVGDSACGTLCWRIGKRECSFGRIRSSWGLFTVCKNKGYIYFSYFVYQ